MRINDKAAKKTTVRLLQRSGVINSTLDPEEYLNNSDIEIDMEDVDVDNIVED